MVTTGFNRARHGEFYSLRSFVFGDGGEAVHEWLDTGATRLLNSCFVCGDGYLIPHKDDKETEYKGVTEVLPLYYSVCTCCGYQADAEEVRKNAEAMRSFKAKVDESRKRVFAIEEQDPLVKWFPWFFVPMGIIALSGMACNVIDYFILRCGICY